MSVLQPKTPKVKAPKRKPAKPKQKGKYPTKALIIGFVFILGFSACDAMKERDANTSEPEPVATVPALVPTAYPLPSSSANGQLSEAEQNYLTYAKEQLATGESDKELINAGYTLCGYFKESANRPELFRKIDEASDGNQGRLNHLINLSSYASRTICPEFASFK